MEWLLSRSPHPFYHLKKHTKGTRADQERKESIEENTKQDLGRKQSKERELDSDCLLKEADPQEHHP